MRFRFIQQNTLDTTPIGEVKIDEKSRHELAPLLAGLQYLFVSPELNESIYTKIEKKVMAGKKQTGRLGMSLWEILVLGSVRLCLNASYDELQDLANHHTAVRGILGVETKNLFSEGHKYELSTIKENVGLLDELTLKEINIEIVKSGHALLKKNEKKMPLEKKEEKIVLKVKSDTFPVAANVHFPTDINLLWDCLRKSLDTLKSILSKIDLSGWRKIVYIQKSLKKIYRSASEIHRKKGKNYKERLMSATKDYLDNSRKISLRIKTSIQSEEAVNQIDTKVLSLIEELRNFVGLLDKHIDLVERRIVKEETIPHNEKLFSIFEKHVEWLSKGKLHDGVVLGHNVLISTDQYQFIIDSHVAESEVDKELAIGIGERIYANYGTLYYLESSSFDRGFYSRLAKASLEKRFAIVIMPKPGKKSEKEEDEESGQNYIKLRNRHSAVESNINELRHSGADFVPDKGLDGFKEYIGWGVLAYNLKKLGKMILEQKRCSKKVSQNLVSAA